MFRTMQTSSGACALCAAAAGGPGRGSSLAAVAGGHRVIPCHCPGPAGPLHQLGSRRRGPGALPAALPTAGVGAPCWAVCLLCMQGAPAAVLCAIVQLQDPAAPGTPAAPGQDREAPQEVKSPPRARGSPAQAAGRSGCWAGAAIWGCGGGTQHPGKDRPHHLRDGKQLLIRNPQTGELIWEPAAVGGWWRQKPGGTCTAFPQQLSPSTAAPDQLSSRAAAPVSSTPLQPECDALRAALGLDPGPARALVKPQAACALAPSSPPRGPIPPRGSVGAALARRGSSSLQSPSALLRPCPWWLPVVRSEFTTACR